MSSKYIQYYKYIHEIKRAPLSDFLQYFKDSFHTHGIVYDNSPWRPGRELDLAETDEQRKLRQKLSTKIMSNGVEVVLKEKEDNKTNNKINNPRKRGTLTTSKNGRFSNRSLVASKLETVLHHHIISATIPIQHLIRNSYIVKTCLTTFTYFTTFYNNDKNIVTSYETIVSVVNTENIKNIIENEMMQTINPTTIKFKEIKTIKPTRQYTGYTKQSIDAYLDDRVDSGYDFIEPSESGDQLKCTTSPCNCVHLSTEAIEKYNTKNYYKRPGNIEVTKLDSLLSSKLKYETNKNTFYNIPQTTPSEMIVEKYTEVINDYSDEKIDDSDLLTNEQAPQSGQSAKKPVKVKTKAPKPSNTKFIVEDLFKLGLKGLSHLAPVVEKMTEGLKKRQENNKQSTTQTPHSTNTTITTKQVAELTGYSANKDIDSEITQKEAKKNHFPMYIPVDELTVAESQNIYINSSFNENKDWNQEENQERQASHNLIKTAYESPLVNGGIPISPGEIITANSDVIVGKPAVGGPLTLAASGIKLKSQKNPDMYEQNLPRERPYVIFNDNNKSNIGNKPIPILSDDSYDLRPPHPASNQAKPKAERRPLHSHIPPTNDKKNTNKHIFKPPLKDINIPTSFLDHRRPVFFDYPPSLSDVYKIRPEEINQQDDLSDSADSSASSSEVIKTSVKSSEEFDPKKELLNLKYKPFFVDIQPSKVANILIPHGSSASFVYSGSAEPHKTGEYVDEMLPYPEPGYFGSFNIDASKLNYVQKGSTNVVNKAIHTQGFLKDHRMRKPINFNNKYKNFKRPQLPQPTSNQETHLQFGPYITSYNPDLYRPNGNEHDHQENLKHKLHNKNIIDKEYENHLAVPPPPPHIPSSNFPLEPINKNIKPYQTPVIHKKPLHDMKTFLSIQHPRPNVNEHNSENLKSTVTSELYFATPGSKKYQQEVPAYTFNLTPKPNLIPNNYMQIHQPNNNNTVIFGQVPQDSALFEYTQEKNQKENDDKQFYSITLNTATNVGEQNWNNQNVVGTSFEVPISENDSPSTSIAVGANAAFNVENSPTSYDAYEISRKPLIDSEKTTEQEHHTPNNNKHEDKYENEYQPNIIGKPLIETVNEIPSQNPVKNIYYNSHANFPMTIDDSMPLNQHINPVTEVVNIGTIVKLTHENNIHNNKAVNSHGPYISAFETSSLQPVIQAEPEQNSHFDKTKNEVKNSVRNNSEIKPVYEDSEVIIDGVVQETEPEEEVSLESMKIPVISISATTAPPLKSTTSLLLNRFKESDSNQNNGVVLSINSGSQTEKPFIVNNSPQFQSNEIITPFRHIPMKPKPFEVNIQTQTEVYSRTPVTTTTSKAVKQVTFDLNIGEQLSGNITRKPQSYKNKYRDSEIKWTVKPRPTRPTFSIGNTTATQKTPFTSRNRPIYRETTTFTPFNATTERTTSSTAIIHEEIYNNITANSSIADMLLPPPLSTKYPVSQNAEEVIMGMSPPPIPQRSTTTTRRPSVDYSTHTPRPRPKIKHRPKVTDKSQEDVSTYRPTFDILRNKVNRPVYKNPTVSPIKHAVISPSIAKTQTENYETLKPTIVFPSLSSTGWITSVASTSVLFETDIIKTTTESGMKETITDSDPESQNELEVVPIEYNNVTDNMIESIETTTKSLKKTEVNSYNNNSTQINDQEKTEDKSTEFPKEELLHKPISIRPTKVEEIIHSTTAISNQESPKNTFIREGTVVHKIFMADVTDKSSIIESSENQKIENLIKATEVLPVIQVTNMIDKSEVVDNYKMESKENIIKTQTEHIIKPVTQIRTETKAITLTETLAEPPKTISTTRFVTLTHTLTVTRTKTSLQSQSPGATTQTLILTNTQYSTLVDVVTEIHTHVMPTIIRETVTEHVPLIQPTHIVDVKLNTQSLDDITMSSESEVSIKGHAEVVPNSKEEDRDTFLIVMNKSQNGGPTIQKNDISEGEYDGATRNEEINNDGVSQVLFGEILLAGPPFLENTKDHHNNPSVLVFNKECQPDCKASRNERCQRVDSIMKCVCRPGFARMFPDRPCKPTYTYSMKLVLSRKGKEELSYHNNLADNSSTEYQSLAEATHEGINRMVMQSDLRDVYQGVHINGFVPLEGDSNVQNYGVINDFYVQLSDNAQEARLREVIEKYLRNNNYSLGGTDVFASKQFADRFQVSDFNECVSSNFHDCSEHAECFNLRGTYTCSCKEGYADLSVNPVYPGRICSAEQIGCDHCNYHGTCYTRDDERIICECFQWYTGQYCHVNLKVILISLATLGVLLVIILIVCVAFTCKRRRSIIHETRQPRGIVATIQSMPAVIHQSALPHTSNISYDKRALINERTDSAGESSSLHNVSLPYNMPKKKLSQASNKSSNRRLSQNESSCSKQKSHPCVIIPRARLHPTQKDSRERKDSSCRNQSLELSTEEKLISYLESEATSNDETMKRKHHGSEDSTLFKESQHKYNSGALVSAGFKVSTTVKHETIEEEMSKHEYNIDNTSTRYNTLRNYSQNDLNEWADAERRICELTLSEVRSLGDTVPASASSARLTHQDANTMAEREVGSTFLLPHVHLYKPSMTSEASEFDSL